MALHYFNHPGSACPEAILHCHDGNQPDELVSRKVPFFLHVGRGICVGLLSVMQQNCTVIEKGSPEVELESDVLPEMTHGSCFLRTFPKALCRVLLFSNQSPWNVLFHVKCKHSRCELQNTLELIQVVHHKQSYHRCCLHSKSGSGEIRKDDVLIVCWQALSSCVSFLQILTRDALVASVGSLDDAINRNFRICTGQKFRNCSCVVSIHPRFTVRCRPT